MTALGFMNVALIIAFISMALGQVMAMVRLVKGPTPGDRILALDTMVINAIGLIVLLGIAQGVRIYFEVTLIIAMLGFVSTVALARFICGGYHRMIEGLGAIIVGICLLVGAGFGLVGAIGLLKLPDSMTRLHAPTKVGTVGIGALLLASMAHAWFFADGSLHEMLIMAFLVCNRTNFGEFYGEGEHSSAVLRCPAQAAAGRYVVNA